MVGMTGDELIVWTRQFLSENGVSDREMPRFAFRAQQYYELPPEEVKRLQDLGIKTDDVLEKITTKQQLERYFRHIDYFYRQLRKK